MLLLRLAVAFEKRWIIGFRAPPQLLVVFWLNTGSWMFRGSRYAGNGEVDRIQDSSGLGACNSSLVASRQCAIGHRRLAASARYILWRQWCLGDDGYALRLHADLLFSVQVHSQSLVRPCRVNFEWIDHLLNQWCVWIPICHACWHTSIVVVLDTSLCSTLYTDLMILSFCNV